MKEYGRAIDASNTGQERGKMKVVRFTTEHKRMWQNLERRADLYRIAARLGFWPTLGIAIAAWFLTGGLVTPKHEIFGVTVAELVGAICFVAGAVGVFTSFARCR